MLLGVFPPCSGFGRFFLLLSVFSFSGDVPRTDHFRLATAGVTCQVPDGRDVGSEQGHRPKNRYFQVSVTRNGLVRVHLGLSLRHCAVSWFRQDVTLQQNQYDDEFFNLGCVCEHVYLIARSAEANHHDHRGPASRFYRPRFRGAAEANLPGHRSPVACLHRSPSTSRLLSSRLAEGSFHCICPSRQQFRTGHQRLWTMQLVAHCTLVAQRPCVKSTSFS